MILLTLVSSKKFLKREALPKELDDGIILQKGSKDRFHSSSIPKTNVKHIIPKPIKQTKPMVNSGINNKSKKYHNQDIPIPIIKLHYNKPIPARPIRPPMHVRPNSLPMQVRPNQPPKPGIPKNK